MNEKSNISTLIRTALERVREADEAYNQATGAHDENLTRFVSTAQTVLEQIERKVSDYAKRFDATPIVQATFMFGLRSVRVAVRRPDAISDEPYITEAAYTAIKTRLGCLDDDTPRNQEPFPIAVVRGATITQLLLPAQ